MSKYKGIAEGANERPKKALEHDLSTADTLLFAWIWIWIDYFNTDQNIDPYDWTYFNNYLKQFFAVVRNWPHDGEQSLAKAVSKLGDNISIRDEINPTERASRNEVEFRFISIQNNQIRTDEQRIKQGNPILFPDGYLSDIVQDLTKLFPLSKRLNVPIESVSIEKFQETYGHSYRVTECHSIYEQQKIIDAMRLEKSLAILLPPNFASQWNILVSDDGGNHPVEKANNDSTTCVCDNVVYSYASNDVFKLQYGYDRRLDVPPTTRQIILPFIKTFDIMVKQIRAKYPRLWELAEVIFKCRIDNADATSFASGRIPKPVIPIFKSLNSLFPNQYNNIHERLGACLKDWISHWNEFKSDAEQRSHFPCWIFDEISLIINEFESPLTAARKPNDDNGSDKGDDEKRWSPVMQMQEAANWLGHSVSTMQRIVYKNPGCRRRVSSGYQFDINVPDLQKLKDFKRAGSETSLPRKRKKNSQ